MSSRNRPARQSWLERVRTRRAMTVTQVLHWDAPDLKLPEPDLEVARARIDGYLAQLLKRDAIDEAHGDAIDSLAHDIAETWRVHLRTAYLDRDQELAEARRQGERHLRRLELALASLDRRLARAQAQNDRAHADLAGEEPVRAIPEEVREAPAELPEPGSARTRVPLDEFGRARSDAA